MTFYKTISLDRSKLKAFADDKIKVSEKLRFVFRSVESIVEKKKKSYQHFLLFPQFFHPSVIKYSFTFILSSANPVNLDLLKVFFLLCGKGLNWFIRFQSQNLPDDKIFNWSELEALAGDKLVVTKKKTTRLVLERVENNVGKGKMLITSIFSFSNNVFQSLPQGCWNSKMYIISKSLIVTCRESPV